MKGWLGTKKPKDDAAKSPSGKDEKNAKTPESKSPSAAQKGIGDKRTMSVKNILSAALGRRDSQSNEPDSEKDSVVNDDELEYQSCSLPVNVFDVNDEATLSATSLAGLGGKKKTYELPADSRTSKQVISGDQHVVILALQYAAEGTVHLASAGRVNKNWCKYADSDAVWKKLHNSIRCRKNMQGVDSHKSLKQQYKDALSAPELEASPADDSPDAPPKGGDGDLVLGDGGDAEDDIHNVGKPLVESPKPEDEEATPVSSAPAAAEIAVIADTKKAVVSPADSKPKEKLEPIDPRPFYLNDPNSIDYTEEPEENAVWGEEHGKKVLDAATLSKLIEILTSPTYYDPTFLHTIMLTFRSFADRNTLIDKLFERFNMPPPKNSSHEEFAHFKKNQLDRVRTRVTQTYKYWIENFYLYDFGVDPEALKKIEGIAQNMEKCNATHLAKMINTAVEKMRKEDNSGRVRSDLKCPPPLLPKKSIFGGNKKKVDIMKWPLLEVARQITMIDFAIFSKIEPKECLNQAWNKGHRETKAPNIYRMINWFNQLSNWVGSVIVQLPELEDRVKMMGKFIELANHCKELNNFNALFSVLSGLALASIFRLKQTWAALPPEVAQQYKDLQKYTSREKNFKEVRVAIRSVKPPCIPYIGLYLTDLTFIEDGNPKYVGDKINFVKCRKFAEVIRDMQTYQNSRYALQEVPEVRDMLLAVVPFTEDQMYKESLAREGRTGGPAAAAAAKK